MFGVGLCSVPEELKQGFVLPVPLGEFTLEFLSSVCVCACVCVKATGETCFSNVWQCWFSQDWAKLVWLLSFLGLEKIRGAGEGLVAAGGVRMVQRPTASAELLDTLHLLCHFKSQDSTPQSYSTVGLLVPQSLWHFSTQCPCLPAVMGTGVSH